MDKDRERLERDERGGRGLEEETARTVMRWREQRQLSEPTENSRAGVDDS